MRLRARKDFRFHAKILEGDILDVPDERGMFLLSKFRRLWEQAIEEEPEPKSRPSVKDRMARLQHVS